MARGVNGDASGDLRLVPVTPRPAQPAAAGLISRPSSGRIGSLTGLRGYSAAWVLLYHVQALAPAIHAGWPTDIPLLDQGWAAVDLFFILSGFLLMRAHEREMAQPTRRMLLGFAALRLARVYPLNLVTTGLIALLLASDHAFRSWFQLWDPGHLALVDFLATSALATRWFLPAVGSVNPPVWSLSTEMLGYAAFPLLAWALSRRLQAAHLAALAAAALAALAAIQIGWHRVGVNDMSQDGGALRMATGLGVGVLLWRFRQQAHATLAAWAGPVSAVAALAVTLASLGRAGVLLLPACFAVLILALSFDDGVISRVLSSAPSLFLGRISFPLYLCHLVPLLWLMTVLSQGPTRPAWQAAAALCGVVAFVIMLATLLHVVVEYPAQRWGRARAARRPAPVCRPH